MSARELYETMPAFDPVAAEAVARAYLQEEGDLPESVWHSLGFVQRDPAAMRDRLLDMRAEHFRALGKEPPPYTQTWE